ncbi:MAG TPA: nuclear transport factor 2 family protein [Mycobacteriales bacterium]|nr:nuclear transport factor 2 family protein [Mycobacteriales bacterium]
MMELQEISDRLEIQDVLARYSNAIDTMQWDQLDALFTADADIDYTSMGGIRGTLAEQKAFLEQNLPTIFQRGFQHLAATTLFDIDGDTARIRTICFNPMVLEDTKHVLFCGMWYQDTLLRVDGRWRIHARVQDRGWSLDLRR